MPRSGACTVIGAPVDVGTCRVGVPSLLVSAGSVGGRDGTMQGMSEVNRQFDVRHRSLYSAVEGNGTRMERALHDREEVSNLYALKRRNILI